MKILLWKKPIGYSDAFKFFSFFFVGKGCSLYKYIIAKWILTSSSGKILSVMTTDHNK